MRFHVGKVEIRIHPLLPMALLLMSYSGEAAGFLTAFFCVLLHESGHFVAALLMKLPVFSLEIMPLGGVLHVGGLYRLSAARMLVLSGAGPLVSLVAAITAICYPESFSLRFALINLLLCAFNLLPGMPMDGGRMLAALLCRKAGARRSVRIAVQIGRCIGAGLLMLSAWILITSGRLMIPLLLMGVYVLSCAGKELQNCELSAAEDMVRLMSASRISQPTPVQAICCEEGVAPAELLQMLRTDRLTLLFYDNGKRWETDLDWLRRQVRT